MKKDIDTILKENCLELTLGGNTYVIEDISLDSFLRFVDQQGKSPEKREDVRRQLEAALGLEKNTLDNVGLRAATIAFDTINEWLRGESKTGKSEDSDSSPPLT